MKTIPSRCSYAFGTSDAVKQTLKVGRRFDMLPSSQKFTVPLSCVQRTQREDEYYCDMVLKAESPICGRGAVAQLVARHGQGQTEAQMQMQMQMQMRDSLTF